MFQHLGARCVENEQFKAFHFACPAKAVDRFQHLRINAESINRVLQSLAFCQTPGNPGESSNVTGKKAEDTASVTEGQAEQTQSKLLPTD